VFRTGLGSRCTPVLDGYGTLAVAGFRPAALDARCARGTMLVATEVWFAPGGCGAPGPAARTPS